MIASFSVIFEDFFFLLEMKESNNPLSDMYILIILNIMSLFFMKRVHSTAMK